VRRRAAVATALAVVALVVLTVAVPAPFRLRTEGVLWLPEEAHVRAQADGFVRAVLASSGAAVQAGASLVASHDPVLTAELRVSESRIAELQARLDQQLFSERVQAEITRQELTRELAAHHHLMERSERLVARAHVAGTLVLDRPDDLPGRYFRKGETFGYVVHDARRIVRMVVTQDDVDLVRTRLRRVDVRFAEHDDVTYVATLLREAPAAKEELPSRALSSEGGGKIAADPRDPKGGKALATTFQFDLLLPQAVQAANYGGRVHVRLVLEPEPLARQLYRRVRQLFLAQFHV
jgi:putative peptide zinc metalloprotease protein